jgi:molybdenum cofactor synthesis domain-containing protein
VGQRAPAGEDIAAGSTMLAAGTTLRPAELGLLAAIGRTTAPVHRRPRVAIVSTGDEVVTPGERRGPGQIWDSNRFTLAAMAQAWGAETTLLGVAPDQVEALTATLAAAATADLIVTSGGVSLGDYDLVKDVLRAEGDVAIWQVRMKPANRWLSAGSARRRCSACQATRSRRRSASCSLADRRSSRCSGTAICARRPSKPDSRSGSTTAGSVGTTCERSSSAGPTGR